MKLAQIANTQLRIAPFRPLLVRLLWLAASTHCMNSLSQKLPSADPSAPTQAPVESLAPASVEIQSLDRLEAEQQRLKKLTEGKPKAYEDRVMDPADRPPPRDGNDAPPDLTNLGVRSVVVETRFGTSRSTTDGLVLRASEWGLRNEYRRETINHGEWVLQADTHYRSGNSVVFGGSTGRDASPTASRLTLRNLGFPVTPSTFADTAIGDIQSDVTEALSRNYRFSLGSSNLRGISAQVFDRDFDLRVGLGKRGALVGSPYPGFESRGGSLLWVGGTVRSTNKLFAGFQLNRAVGLPNSSNVLNSVVDSSDNGSRIVSTAASVGYGYDLLADGDKKARLTLISSQTTGGLMAVSSRATGVFVEGGLRSGRFRHEFGTYKAQPYLSFGDYSLPSDNQGAYWRLDYIGNRLSWGGGVEVERTNPEADSSRIESRRAGLSGNFQYRVNRDTSLGSNVSFSQIDYLGSSAVNLGKGSRTVNASAFYGTRFSDFGRSRFSFTVRRNETLVANAVAATGEEIQWEHDWITAKYETQRPELSTTLGFARDRSSGETQKYPTLGLVFRYWTDAGYSIGGNLRYTSRTGNLSTSRGLAGTVNSERSLGDGWVLGGSLSLNQAVLQTTFNPTLTPQLIRSSDKTVFLYLRWQETTGTPYQSIGLRNLDTAGAGAITGVVYFDANRDGERQAGEGGAANVEVVLDQRFRVVTDKDGRFDFPLVATGRHQLKLKLESIPLPWGNVTDGGLNIDVPLRDLASINIPVVRVGQ